MSMDMVKILVSPGFGAGWFTWNTRTPECLTDPDIIAAVEAKDFDKAAELASAKWPEGYWGGAGDLEVRMLPKGTMYRITEYDGSESLETRDGTDWMVA